MYLLPSRINNNILLVRTVGKSE